MSESVINPVSGAEIGLVERHHVESIMAATDIGADVPDEDDRTLRIWDSYPSSPSTEIGHLDKAYGFKVIPQLTKSFPFSKEKLAGLLFEQDSELKEMMVKSIVEENKRQIQGRSVEYTHNPRGNLDLDSALAGEDGLTPKDAEKSRTGSWADLRRR